MIDYDLEMDEGILLENETVTWIADETINVNEMILTNKNIILVYDKKTGIFSKEKATVKKPLSDIKIINEKPMVDQIRKIDYGVCLQIQFVYGRELFAFDTGGKKNSTKWVNSIYEVLTGSAGPMPEKANSFTGLNGFKDSFKSVAEQAKDKVASVSVSAMDTVSEIAKNTADRSQNNTNYGQNLYRDDRQASANSVSFCSNCGTKLVKGAKFCSGCGAPVGATSSMQQSGIQSDPTIREQKFAGVVLKCPNCGATIGQTTAVCPECGHYITGQTATNAVQIFADKIMALEANRKKAGLGQFFGATDPVDKQKLSLIRSFPIPNTVDDIHDFMLLAAANIDVGLSKNTLLKRMDAAYTSESNSAMPKIISDAWVLKFQQAYQMASNAFPGEPIFDQIKKLYMDKMRELKIKVE